ncbi:MAG: hypothetical protein II977_06900 [Oscillospiraceae bacterium]|nr:hypothetical protein [Oscillospiraceae bacterium]
MKYIFKFIMGLAVFFAACGAVLSYFSNMAKEHRYIVINENREEII